MTRLGFGWELAILNSRATVGHPTTSFMVMTTLSVPFLALQVDRLHQ
jgi:hypothetical protein